MPNVGNEFWGPSLTLTWRPKQNLTTRKDCSCKNFHNFDIYGDEDRCPKCQGSGYIYEHFNPPKPEWPDDYVKYMQRCHELYLKRTRKFRG